MYFYTYILIIALLIIAIICWIEFYGLISKIFEKNNLKHKLKRHFYKILSLLYLSFFCVLVIVTKSKNPELELILIYSLLVSINSDLGGIIFGRFFKGKKLSKLSPNKTLSGSIGSFLFSISLVPFFTEYFPSINIFLLLIFAFLISLVSQMGDLFISLLKRKAKVKDTGDLLPGHGGFLDRVDGIIFAVPFGFFLFNLL